jgi:hypothetical protein
MVAAAVPLLNAIGTFLLGLGYFMYSLSDAGFFHLLGSIEWSAMLNSFHTAPIATPLLSPGTEALHSQFQKLMEMHYQMAEMKRQMLTMPALPPEGF